VHRRDVNAFKDTINLENLRPGQNLEFKPQRYWVNCTDIVACCVFIPCGFVGGYRDFGVT
jgi:hypothetical protein